MDVSLDAAYERLLSALGQRIGAARAELLLHAQAGEPARTIAPAGVAGGAPAAQPIVIAIRDGAHEIGQLRISFADGAPPSPAERALAQSLAELAGLLIEDHQRLIWEPLRQASRRILTVTEEELQRIILDIHDGPVQKLFAVSSQLAMMQRQLEDSPAELRLGLAPTAARAAQLIESALHDIRATLSSFRLAEFQRRPLPAVLHALAVQHESLTGNQVDLQIDGEIPPVSMPVKIALYRVLQESLSNAYRHAGVDRHAVRLSGVGSWVTLEVADQGRGFEPPPLEGPGATEREEHIGLRGMRERMHLVGGNLQLISQPGQGTRVIVQVPSDA